MDLQKNLIESSTQKGKRKTWKASIASIALHAMLVGSIVYASTHATHRVDAEEPMKAFLTRGAAPPPPPPPPPPSAAANTSAPKSTPKIARVEPTPVQTPTFVQPTEIPQELPKVQPLQMPDPTPSTDAGTDDTSATEADAGVPGGVPGGVAGGVQGGVVGGEVGGTIGGTIGGEIGGVIGGQLGGTVGGTGTGTGGEGTGGDVNPDVPMRVGGDVKAPIVTKRVEPEYTEPARKARVSGVVVVEAIINQHGEVEEARVIKGLPMGLAESAVRAVKQWRFKPGTLNGQQVSVIFNLTVTFKLDS